MSPGEVRETIERCAGCGLTVPGGTAGCQEIMDEVLARDFSSPAYFRVHRMMVDTYSLQHPDRYCLSAKSLAAHLTGLCWLLEHGGSRATGSEALRRWLDGTPQIEKPELPSFRGELTIALARAAADPEGYADAVDRWARSTWASYVTLHPIARAWVHAALTVPRRSQPT